jgi:hypothetical protein
MVWRSRWAVTRFPFQRGADLSGGLDMLDQQVMDAVGAEAGSSGVGEQDLPVPAWRFAEPGFQHGARRFGQRDASFFAALPNHMNMRTSTERDVVACQSGHFGQTEPRLHGHQEEGVIAPAEPST